MANKPLIHIVETEAEYWGLVGRFSGPSEVFDAQGDAHGEIDLALSNAIEDILVPVVGPWEQSGVWFHSMDFWGDGIRSLIFRKGDFPFHLIPKLQALLVGDAAAFCITVQICNRLLGDGIETVGAIALTRGHIVVTEALKSEIKILA